MLLGDFYTYKVVSNTEGEVLTDIKLNKEHDIFKGHFPGQPIVPGVCQVLMVKEIFSAVLDQELQLASSKSIKFLKMLDPNETADIQAKISYKTDEDQYKVNATLASNSQNFLKLRGVYSEK